MTDSLRVVPTSGLAEKQRDEVTADPAIERSAFDEKAALVLQAIAAQ